MQYNEELRTLKGAATPKMVVCQRSQYEYGRVKSVVNLPQISIRLNNYGERSEISYVQ